LLLVALFPEKRDGPPRQRDAVARIRLSNQVSDAQVADDPFGRLGADAGDHRHFVDFLEYVGDAPDDVVERHQESAFITAKLGQVRLLLAAEHAKAEVALASVRTDCDDRLAWAELLSGLQGGENIGA
jgi:hypothetical protein